jgi:seryl-tRNA(Sec) selenium transferase
VFYKNLCMDGQISLELQIEIAKKHGIPLIVDAAAQLPPVENLWNFTRMGADLALFSGGKGLCGPQSSGLILGRKDLITACAFNACPRPFIGQPMKAGKEEIVGLMAAVRSYLDLDHAALMQTYEDQVSWIVAAFSGIPHVSARRSFPSEAGQPMPRAEIILSEQSLGISRDEVLRQLYTGSPAIHLSPAGATGIYVNPQTLQDGQERIIVKRIKEITGI